MFLSPPPFLPFLTSLSPLLHSDEDTDEEDENQEPQDRRQKVQPKIPDWARGAQLKEALDRQFGVGGGVPMNPDEIFPEVQTCSLEEIFGVSYGRAGA